MAPPPDASPSGPHGAAEAALRACDWSATPLGPRARWPRSLRGVVDLMLRSRLPIIALWGEAGTMIYNDGYAEIAGARHPGLMGQPVREGWPEVADFNGRVIEAALRGETLSFRDAAMVLQRDGAPEEAWFDLDYTPIDDDDGRPGGALAVVIETTARRRAEQALAELNRTLEQQVAIRTQERDSLWQLSPDLIAVIREDGTVRSVNPAWTTVLGWPPGELVGRRFPRLAHPEDVAAAEAALRRSARQAPHRFEHRQLTRGGATRWISWSATSGADGDIYAYGRDVTEARLAAQALADTQEALRQSQKMEAVGQLTGGIAHDFNNLLQGIIGSLDMVRRRVGQGRVAELDRFVANALASAGRAASLTHRLLAFSRRQPLDPRPVEANALAASMAELLRRTMGERIEIAFELEPALWRTLCDPHQLESALLNLAINARDAMPQGGRLIIATANARIEAGRVDGGQDVKPGDYVRLSVSDNGVGMTREVMQRAFEPFFTTKPIGKGTGLGLSMIYGFTCQSEGHARIESAPGAGCTVSLFLPRHDGAALAEPAGGRAADPPRAERSAHVLVAEDEPVVRSLIAEALHDLGYTTLQAGDGAAALELLRDGPAIDLLITDIGLPALNGRELAEAARARHPGLRVLFMTGYAETAAAASGFLQPGMAMITKPFAIEPLAERIRAILAGP